MASQPEGINRYQPERYPFGLFLVDQKVISQDELELALVVQRDRHMRVGQLAQRRNYMTFEKICQVREFQQKYDIHFGQAAVQLGFITVAELRELLEFQDDSHLRLGAVLVDLNFVDRSALDRQLGIYIRKFIDSNYRREDASEEEQLPEPESDPFFEDETPSRPFDPSDLEDNDSV